MLNKQERQFKSVIVTFVINFKFMYVIMLVKINNFCPYSRVAKLGDRNAVYMVYIIVSANKRWINN